MINRTGFYLTRALIGACEGGFIPGTILFASYFYKSRELGSRLAVFWSTLNVSDPTPTDSSFQADMAIGSKSYIIIAGSRHSPNARSGRKAWLVLVVPFGRPPDLCHRSRCEYCPELSERPFTDPDPSELPLPSHISNVDQKHPLPASMVHRARGNYHDQCKLPAIQCRLPI